MDYPVSDPTVGLVGGKFSDGDAVGGVAASRDPAAWANAVTDELLAIIAAAGLTPDEADLNQVLDALVLLGLRAATSTLTGVVELATDAEVQAGTDTARVVTPAGLASFAQALSASGYKKFPGGAILQWGVTAAGTSVPVTFPVTFPNAVYFINVFDADYSSTPTQFGSGDVALSSFVALCSASKSMKWFALGK